MTLVLPKLARRTLRITLFITPKYLQLKPKITDERQYNDLALRFIKTVLFSNEKNHRTFFEKNLAQISSIIPLRLLVPYFVDELSEVIENGLTSSAIHIKASGKITGCRSHQLRRICPTNVLKAAHASTGPDRTLR